MLKSNATNRGQSCGIGIAQKTISNQYAKKIVICMLSPNIKEKYFGTVQ